MHAFNTRMTESELTHKNIFKSLQQRLVVYSMVDGTPFNEI